MISSKKKLLDKCSELGITCAKNTSKEKIIELIQQKEKVKIFNIPSTWENGSKINYVYHLADIHIRYIERHEEYKLIFQKLYDQIEKDKCYDNSVMVISGDIFHNRDRFVSETIVLFNDFIKKITSFMDVFVILGNHDCFNHNDRLDSISGIQQIADYSRFHLLKETGIYNFNNLSFGVSSLLDGGRIPKAPEEVPGITRICLYHGIVSGSKLDNGTTQESDVTISSFNDYDIVMLGDIHKRQYLNPQKTIAYPGSLIQQSFGEEKEHGYLKWDTFTNTSKFVALHNDYSFVTLPLNLDLKNITFTEYSRIRLLINSSDTEQDITKLSEECEKYTKVLSIKKVMKDPTLNTKGEVPFKGDVITSNEVDIIKSFTSEDMFPEILKLHNLMSSDLDQEEVFTKSVPWTITKIEFRNIFSYGNDILNVIDLKEGVSGILANNASGKTNIMNTILYGLFGSSRTQNHLNKNIISRFSKKEDLLVKLTVLLSDGKKYFIERTAKTKTRSRIKSSEAGQLDVSETLKFYTDDEILNLSSKTDTEKLLRDTLSIIGKDEFIMTNMMSNTSYGNNMSIISMTGTQFDETFNNIFNLNKYVTLHKNIKTLYKSVSEDLKTKQVKLDLLTTNLKKYDISKSLELMNDLEKTISVKKEAIKNITNTINDIYSDLLKTKATGVTKSKALLQKEIEELNEILSEYSGDILLLSKREDEIMADYKNLRKSYHQELTSGPDPMFDIQESVDEIEKEISCSEMSKKKIEFDADYTNQYIKAKKYLKTSLAEDSLNLNNVVSLLKNLDIENEYYLLHKDTFDTIMTELDKTYFDPSLLLKYKKIVEEKEQRDADISNNIKLDQKINKLKKKLKERRIQDAYKIKSDLSKMLDLLDYIDAYHQLKDVTKDLEVIENNKNVNILLDKKCKASLELDNLRECLKKDEINLVGVSRDIKSYNEIFSEIGIIKPILESLESKLQIYRVYSDITHQKNLPKKIISNVIKNVTDDANVLIYNTTGLLCEIQENEKWEVVVRKGDLVLGPEHCSGYERFILNTALKISFDKYKQLSSIKLFMIDETIDCVSESNFDQIDVLLECLEKNFNKVILISHNEDLKKKIKNRIGIKIEKKNSIILQE